MNSREEASVRWVIRQIEKESGLTWQEILSQDQSVSMPLVSKIIDRLNLRLEEEARKREEEARKREEEYRSGAPFDLDFMTARANSDSERCDKVRAATLVLRQLARGDRQTLRTAARAGTGRRTFPCPKCNGSGRVGCPLCDGHGSYPKYFPGSGDITETCGECGGSGAVGCHQCGGGGSVDSSFGALSEEWRR
jgi:hypothetical protein